MMKTIWGALDPAMEDVQMKSRFSSIMAALALYHTERNKDGAQKGCAT